MDSFSAGYNRVFLKGLVVECPAGKALDDYPVGEIKSLPVARRMIAVDTMAAEQVEEIVVYHRQCMKRREGC